MELLKRAPLQYVTTDIEQAAAESDVSFIVVPTPSGADDRFDASMVIDAARRVAAGFNRRDAAGAPTIVVVSTVMPGTCAGPVRAAIDAECGGIGLVYHPEFIALGTVVRDLMHPACVYLGADDMSTAGQAWDVLRRVAPGAPPVFMSATEAEVAKLAVNLYLSVKVGFANEVAAVARSVGADPENVLQAVGTDGRIGSAYLRHGAPPSGPCLPRDVRAWAAVRPWSRYARAAALASDDVVHAALDACDGAESVGVLGYAYKPGGFLPDESFGWKMAATLAGTCRVIVHDPRIAGAPPGCERGSVGDVLGCDAVVVGCEHDEYAGIEHPRLIRP